VSQGARVLNLSFAGPPDPLFHRAVKAAYDRRTIIVAAAGNAGPVAPPAYPAAYEEVIAVTATDSADRLYSQANHGAYIAIAAPGVDILAPSVGRAHELRTGTSFAAAHVSGIIALMLERNPQLSPETARMALIAAASDLGPPGRDDEFGAGRANAYGSLRLLEQAKGPAGP
jgi:subtilisin family serine protease